MIITTFQRLVNLLQFFSSLHVTLQVQDNLGFKLGGGTHFPTRMSHSQPTWAAPVLNLQAPDVQETCIFAEWCNNTNSSITNTIYILIS